MHRDPATLITAIGQGDEKALSDLYDAYSGALFGLILRRTGSQLIAENVLQEAFFRIWKKAGEYDPQKERPYTWMVHQACTATMEALSSKDPESVNGITSLDSVHAIQENGLIGTIPVGKDVHGLIDVMSQEHRQILDLAYDKGCSREQIAQHMGLPLDSLNALFRSALLELRALLEDHK